MLACSVIMRKIISGIYSLHILAEISSDAGSPAGKDIRGGNSINALKHR